MRYSQTLLLIFFLQFFILTSALAWGTKPVKCGDAVSVEFAKRGLGTFDNPRLSFKTVNGERVYFNSKAQEVASVIMSDDDTLVNSVTLFEPATKTTQEGTETDMTTTSIALDSDCHVTSYNKDIRRTTYDKKGNQLSDGTDPYYHVSPDFCAQRAPILSEKGCSIKSDAANDLASKAGASRSGWGYLIAQSPEDRAFEAYYGVCKSYAFKQTHSALPSGTNQPASGKQTSGAN